MSTDIGIDPRTSAFRGCGLFPPTFLELVLQFSFDANGPGLAKSSGKVEKKREKIQKFKNSKK